MSSSKVVEKTISILIVFSINLIQLFQALSFLKHAPKGGSWNSEVKDFIDWSKDLAFRVEDDDFLAFYSISVIVCGSCFILFVVLFDLIYKLNTRFNVLSIIQYTVEYIVFGLGFIPMISKFIEVQICNNDLKIDSYTSVKCYKDEQMVMLNVGFTCVGIAYLFNTVIIPSLRFDRNGIEKLWASENYIEGIYYLNLLAACSLYGWLKRPEVGVVVCGLSLLYGIVFECYDHLSVACSRCAVLASLTWAYAAAYVLKDDHTAGNNMIYCLPIAYILGAVVRVIRQKLVKRKYGLSKKVN